MVKGIKCPFRQAPVLALMENWISACQFWHFWEVTGSILTKAFRFSDYISTFSFVYKAYIALSKLLPLILISCLLGHCRLSFLGKCDTCGQILSHVCVCLLFICVCVGIICVCVFLDCTKRAHGSSTHADHFCTHMTY